MGTAVLLCCSVYQQMDGENRHAASIPTHFRGQGAVLSTVTTAPVQFWPGPANTVPDDFQAQFAKLEWPQTALHRQPGVAALLGQDTIHTSSSQCQRMDLRTPASLSAKGLKRTP